MTLQETLGKRLIYLDGGMGAVLQAAGLRGGEVPESWNLSHPEAVKAVHRAYLDAGGDIVTTNAPLGATSLRFGPELPGRRPCGRAAGKGSHAGGRSRLGGL